MHTGVNAMELDREIKGVAARCVETGRTPESLETEALQWAMHKAHQIYPRLGLLPPPPRAPLVKGKTMALIAVPFVLLWFLVLGQASGPSSKTAGLFAACAIFWVTYVLVWILVGRLSAAHRKTLDHYWARHDPYRWHRGPDDMELLTRDLLRLMETAVRDAWDEYRRPLATVAPQKVSAAPRAPLPWTPKGQRPRPRVSCTDREAEFLARDWMLYLGADKAEVSSATRDGGMDVVSAKFVAEVKHHAAPVPPSLVRQIFGVATHKQKMALFFSLSGYSAAAMQFARETGVALFVYDYAAGTLNAKSPTAKKALSQGLDSLVNR